MPLIPTLPITITPRPMAKWGSSSHVRIINEIQWLDVDYVFLLDSDAERSLLGAMYDFSIPEWLSYSLPAGYMLRLIDEPRHNFINGTRSKSSAKFEATHIANNIIATPVLATTEQPQCPRCDTTTCTQFATTLIVHNVFTAPPAPIVTAPDWLCCAIPADYISQRLSTHITQRFASNRSRITERSVGLLKDVSISLKNLSRPRFFEFLTWWSESLNFGMHPFFLNINGAESSCWLLGWKASKQGLFDLSLEMRIG